MAELLSLLPLSVFCVYLMLCVSAGRCRETEQQRKGGGGVKRTRQQKAKVLITYRSNLADDSLKKAEGSSVHSSKGERGDNLLFKSPSDSHLSLTKCLLPIPGLCAMPGCAIPSTLSLPSYLALLLSLCFTLVPHCLLPFYPSHLIYVLSALTFSLCSAFPAVSSLWLVVDQCLYQCPSCCGICVLKPFVLVLSCFALQHSHSPLLYCMSQFQCVPHLQEAEGVLSENCFILLSSISLIRFVSFLFFSWNKVLPLDLVSSNGDAWRIPCIHL